MRLFKSILIVLTFLVGCRPDYPAFIENTDFLKSADKAPFYHGVASGDPTQNSVIIWTRVTPKTQLPEISVNWKLARDYEFNDIVASGQVMTSPDRDYTVKIDIKDLEAEMEYYYAFEALDQRSEIGHTKTAPEEAAEVNFAVVSCSNYEFGYFNGYGAIAEEKGLDAVIHLGDYIYEYAPGHYGDTTIGRIHVPDKELITLQDYRDRYAQYRLDPDLQAAHGAHPFITVWDDHEISNNSYKDGAQNHQEDEGDYQIRRDAAVKAYYEWLPVREADQLYRAFSFGKQVDLIMLDERLAGRTKPADSLNDPSLYEETRSMLGSAQLKWFGDQLITSTANWKVIGNQVIFSYLNWGHPTFSINLDSWDGYPTEQDEIANIIHTNQIKDVVFVTGDTHSGWAFEVTHRPFDGYDPLTAFGAYALEFGTTSINSANSNERFSDEEVLAHEKKIVNSPINPHLKYANMRDHGYMILQLTDEEVKSTWKYVETLREPNRSIASQVSISADRGSVKLKLD